MRNIPDFIYFCPFCARELPRVRPVLMPAQCLRCGAVIPQIDINIPDRTPLIPLHV